MAAAGMDWISSSKCNDGACIEVTFDPGSEAEHVGVRSSTMPDEVLWFSRDEWAAFIAGIRAGEFD